MAKNILLCFICVACSYYYTYGQNTNSVTGTIKDENKNTPVPFATVMLLNTDSVLVKGAVSDSSGNFNIDDISTGNYIIAATSLGMNKNYTSPFSLSGNEKHSIGVVLLTANSKDLNEVDITAKKPLFEQKPGMTIVNVGSSINNIGNSALDVLKKSPGVLVDNNNNISLKGKSGVTVLIDDKPTYLSATDLANMLKNLPATSIDQIEIMTLPPAKYDAAGSAGIINIKLKKNTTLGLNGSANASYYQGIYPAYSAGLNLNYRTGKLNLFGNYNYTSYYAYNHNFITRQFSDSGKPSTIFNQVAEMRFPGQTHTFKAGADYYIDKNNTIGVMVNGLFNSENDNLYTTTNITSADYTPQSSNTSYNYDNTNLNSVTYDLNFKSKFDTAGTTLSGNIDYAQYDNYSIQNFTTDYFDAYGDPVYPPTIGYGNLPSIINISSGKIDFEHPMKNGFKLQAGAKTSFVTSDNNVQYLNYENNEWVNDTGATNHFKYSENINAAYIDVSKDFKKGWSIDAGLRGEQTISKGNQLTIDSTFNKNYFQLFPTLFIKKDIDKNNELTLSYARRVDRPNYQDLNPFRYYLDPYLYLQGNPYLLPQITNDLELSHTYKNFLVTTLSISQTTNVISDVLKQIDSLNITYQTKDNISIFNNISISVAAPLPVFKWWVSTNYVSVYYNQYKGEYLNSNLNLGITSYSINTDNQFTLPKKISLELTANYNGPFVYGILVGKASGTYSIGIEKELWQSRATIKASFTDNFYKAAFAGTVNYEDIHVNIFSEADTRVAALAFTYHFGKNNARSNHTTGIEDEKKRVKSEKGSGGN